MYMYCVHEYTQQFVYILHLWKILRNLEDGVQIQERKRMRATMSESERCLSHLFVCVRWSVSKTVIFRTCNSQYNATQLFSTEKINK